MATIEVCDFCINSEMCVETRCTDCEGDCCMECFDYDNDEPVCLDCKEEREFWRADDDE